MKWRDNSNAMPSIIKLQVHLYSLVLVFLVLPNLGWAEELGKDARIRFVQKILREVSQMVPNISDEFFTSGYEGRIEGEKLGLLKYIGKSQGGIGDGEGL